MTINVREKGAVGEREMCKWLDRHLGIEAERNLEQVRSGGADIITGHFVFEVKRVEKLDVQLAWVQCVVATRKINAVDRDIDLFREPVLAFRKNKRSWRFAISARHIGLQKGYLAMSEMTFKDWAEGVMRGESTNACI